MSSLRRLSSATLAILAILAIGLGCGSRALDPHQMSGTGGVGTLTGAGGAVGDAGASVDVLLPPPLDALGLEPLVERPCICGSCGTNQPCISVAVCGDGVLAAREACDDGNRTDGDGCSAGCTSVETGWRCPVPGRRCAPICGDGRVVGPEACDDGNTMAGDGCSDVCLAEPATARCGDGVIDGAEECDDGALNTDTSYDVGCTTGCRFAATCGDGIVNGPEQCDLGRPNNTVLYGPDGCTPTCTLPHYCGDSIIDQAQGEQCDLGPDNGMPASVCSRNCNIPI